ncbi:hypothetical protein [Agathobacter sp.]
MAKYLDLTGLKYFITKRIGKTDISKIGDGTCTGAISTLNQSLSGLKTNVDNLGIDYYTSTKTTNYVSFSGSIALEDGFYLEVYKIGKIVCFTMRVKIANSNDGAWRVKINKYPMKQTTCHAFSAFKGTGSYVPCYSDSNGYIVNQGGTGKYTIVMSGEYITN